MGDEESSHGTIMKIQLILFPLLFFPGAAKDAPIITPLMDFVRQKRATKGGNRVLLLKLTLN